MKKIRNGTKAREILVITVLILIIIAWGLREIVFESIGIGNRLIEFTYVCSLFISLLRYFTICCMMNAEIDIIGIITNIIYFLE